MATTVHDLCLELAAQTDSRVERYLLLRMAASREVRPSFFDAIVGQMVSSLVAATIGRFMRDADPTRPQSPASAPN